MTMSQRYQEANDLFIEEEYTQAKAAYDELIAEATAKGASVAPALLAEYYNKRSLTHQKLGELQQSSADASSCVEILEKYEGSSKLLVKAAYRVG